VNNFGHLSQNITTTAGQTYNVSFFLQNNGAPLNEFKASFAGFQGLDLVNAAFFNYTQYSFTAVASGPSSVLQFDGFNNPGLYVLDDLSVTAAAAPVPETSTALSLGLLLALGLGGLVVAAKRKKASPSLS